MSETKPDSPPKIHIPKRPFGKLTAWIGLATLVTFIGAGVVFGINYVHKRAVDETVMREKVATNHKILIKVTKKDEVHDKNLEQINQYIMSITNLIERHAASWERQRALDEKQNENLKNLEVKIAGIGTDIHAQVKILERIDNKIK